MKGSVFSIFHGRRPSVKFHFLDGASRMQNQGNRPSKRRFEYAENSIGLFAAVTLYAMESFHKCLLISSLQQMWDKIVNLKNELFSWLRQPKNARKAPSMQKISGLANCTKSGLLVSTDGQLKSRLSSKNYLAHFNSLSGAFISAAGVWSDRAIQPDRVR